MSEVELMFLNGSSKKITQHTKIHFKLYLLSLLSRLYILCKPVVPNFFLDSGTPWNLNFSGVHPRHYSYLPTPPLGQDMTQGQFLSGV